MFSLVLTAYIQPPFSSILAYKSSHDHGCQWLPLVLSFVPEDGHSSVSIVCGGCSGSKECIHSYVIGFLDGLHPRGRGL